MPSSQSATANPSAAPGGSVAYIIQWLTELEECRKGGLVSDEDYALERAEKLSKMLERHRSLWLATVLSFVPFAAAAGWVAWWYVPDWQTAAASAGLAGLLGLLMLSGPIRERMKQGQVREYLFTLRSLLENDLISADEFVVYEERLLGCPGGH